MLTRQELFDKLRELLPELQQRFGVEKIGVFGSFARDDADENSDIDLLVNFSRPVGIEFFSMAVFLEKNFGKKVDLVTRNAIRPVMKDNILNEVAYI